jgi:hypothetical protein
MPWETLVVMSSSLGSTKQAILTQSRTCARIPNHLLWTAACGRGIARRRQKKRDATSTDAAVADPEVISFSNEFLPKTSESETSMDVVAVVADPDAMSFSNEIK